MRHQKLTTLTRVVLLIALCFVGGLIGKQISLLSGSVALVRPPAGIARATRQGGGIKCADGIFKDITQRRL